MLLRRLELLGFKSFADKTLIEFGPGISAIVGPNGSGKSNITDAIRWVLGEVSARALRGQRMEDVIFGGSPGRRSLPLAEVTLILDNSDGTLPLPFAEVSVTRRVDRSGSGDYLINRAACRLRDVQDLFAGTGLGRNAYALVGQGEVDDVLRARPPERRAMVEEAAGVTRYRQRLHEGDRRLAAAAACQERVSDLLGERQRALAALSRQAERAERHGRAQEELRALELRLWAREWRAAAAERREAQGSVEATSAEHEALTEELGLVATLQRDLAAALQEARAAAEGEAQAVQRAERALDQARQEASLAEGLGAAAAAEAGRAESRAAELSGRGRVQAAEAEAATAAAAAAAGRLEAARREAEEAGRALAAATAARQQAAADFAQGQAALARARQELAAAAGTAGTEALSQARAALQAAQARRAEAAAAQARTEAAAAQARAVAPAAEQALQAARRTAGDLRQHRERVAALAGGLRGRVQVLAEVAAAGGGYAQGPRTVLEGRRRGLPAFAGVLGALGELLEVPSHLAAAISAALGGAVQDIVTESADAAERAIAGLKAAQGGRATFLPLGQLRPVPLSGELRALGGRPGALGWAAALVTAEAVVRPAVEHALGRVLVAEDLAAARRLGREAAFRVRLVTLDGDVIHPGGAMSGGSVRGERAGGLLGRDQERRRVQERLDAVAGDEARLGSALQRAAAAAEQAERQSVELRRAAASADAEARAAREAAAAAQREEQRCAAQEQELRQRLQRQGQADPAELAVREAAAAGAAQAAAAALGLAEAGEARAREAATAARIGLATCEQALRGAEADAARAQREAGDLAARLAEVSSDRSRALQTAAAQRQAGAEAALRAAEAEGRLRGAQSRLQGARQGVVELQAQATEAAERREWADRERERLAGELRRAEAVLGRAQAAAAALGARLDAAYGLGVEALEAAPPSERPGPDRERAAALRRELSEIGGVRPEAVAEYRAEAEALTAFASGAEDVQAAALALADWGREMEAALADRYEEALAAVRRHFSAIYARLCGGGTADLVPVAAPAADGTAPSRPPRPSAAPGLEVAAQPPGKQLAHMGLLSGGERTLVAIALVLAFLAVRPAAFCVLDEIEAALDEANVARCAAYLREVAHGTQMLVVTHQKGTMEVADRLVGVTMGDPGISRLLSVRLAG